MTLDGAFDIAGLSLQVFLIDLLLAFLAYAGLLWLTRSIRSADVVQLRQLLTQRRGLQA